MTTLGFENYSDTLRIYLAKYREVSTTSRATFPDLCSKFLRFAS